MKKFLVALTAMVLIFSPLTTNAKGHSELETCYNCNGSGTVSELNYAGEYEEVPCPECDGYGAIEVYYKD